MRISSLVWILTISILVSWWIPTAVESSPIQYIPAATGISLTVNFGNGTTQEYLNLEGTNVFEVTNSTTDVEVEWYGDLVYVLAISGVSEDDEAGLYWQYWVNGDLGPSAANYYILEDGDSIEWALPSYGTDSLSQFDMSLIVGLAIIGLMAVVVLIVLKKRQ